MRRLASLVALAAIGAAPSPDMLRFVTCPIYRDTDAGRKSGCWLADAEETGTRYDVSMAPSKPDWNHPLLVEGRVAPGDGNPCGGIVLDPVRTSVLDGDCTRRMLPAEGFPGRRFALPKRNLSPLSVPRAVPPPPYGPRTFRLFFDFDQSFLIYQYDDYFLDQAIGWLRAAKPKRIAVTGWAAATPITLSGRTIAETPAIARERAEKIAEALTRLGIARDRIDVAWRTDPTPVDDSGADGLVAPSLRRVDIAATF